MNNVAGLDSTINLNPPMSRSALVPSEVRVKLPEWATDAVKDLPGLMNKEEVAAFLKLTPRYVAHLCRQGHIGFVKRSIRGSSRIMISRLQLAEYLARISTGEQGR